MKRCIELCQNVGMGHTFMLLLMEFSKKEYFLLVRSKGLSFTAWSLKEIVPKNIFQEEN